MRKARLAIAAVTVACLAPAGAKAAPFDGRWSVTVISEYGDCDRRFAIPVAVREGSVRYTGRFTSRASGDVSGEGRVVITFRHEGQVVHATGSLRSTFGNGAWESATLACSGTWIARKAR
ncbi:hypothetical protein [Afifella pfennigii]|uniref:hypothetical protein n=1 Tax=Afifella pfennigii TaxID=209897 RepID=UPI000479738C|nr:hypothetical protein [Afifella pfennigii]